MGDSVKRVSRNVLCSRAAGNHRCQQACSDSFKGAFILTVGQEPFSHENGEAATNEKRPGNCLPGLFRYSRNDLPIGRCEPISS